LKLLNSKLDIKATFTKTSDNIILVL